MDGSISLFLDVPQPVCIGYLFLGGGGQILPTTTVYEINKGGETTPLDGVEGVTVNDNGTLFVEDASAVFAKGDELRCTYMSTTHISTIVALSKLMCNIEIMLVLYSTAFSPPTLLSIRNSRCH